MKTMKLISLPGGMSKSISINIFGLKFELQTLISQCYIYLIQGDSILSMKNCKSIFVENQTMDIVFYF